MAITFDPRIDGYFQTSSIYPTMMNPVSLVDVPFTAQQVQNDPYYHLVAIEDQIANGTVDLQKGDTLGNVVDGMQEILASDTSPTQPSDMDVIYELMLYNPDLTDYINDMGLNISTMTPSQVQDLLNLDLNEANIVKLNVKEAMENLRIGNTDTQAQINGLSNDKTKNVNTMSNQVIKDKFANQNPVTFGNSSPEDTVNMQDYTSAKLQPPFRGAEPDADEFSKYNTGTQIHTMASNDLPFVNYLTGFDNTGFGQAIRNRLPSALYGIETQMHLETEPEEVV